MTLRLVLTDCEEEMMLYNLDFDKLADYHNSIFRNSDAAKKEFNTKICAMDTYLPSVVVNSP